VRRLAEGGELGGSGSGFTGSPPPPNAIGAIGSAGAHGFAAGKGVFLGGSTPEVVRRKISAKWFSKQYLDDIDLKGGRRLVGKSKFSKLAALLDEYQAATGKKEELDLLHRIVEACDAWNDSGFRTKKHSKEKQAEEDDKREEVRLIRSDAEREIDEIMSTSDDTLVGSLEDDSKGAALAHTFARAMGASVQALVGLDDQKLLALYKRKIIVEAGLAQWEKGAQGTSPAQNALGIVRHLDGVDLTAMPDGDAKTLVQRLLNLKVHQSTAEWSDDKHAPGPGGPKMYTPQGWDGGALALGGNDDYNGKAEYALDLIGTMPLGQALFRGLGLAPEDKSGKAKVVEDVAQQSHTGVKKKVGSIKPPSLGKARRVDKSGEVMYSNAAGPEMASVDMSNTLIGSEEDAQVDPWRNRDAIVGLFHELLHIYLTKNQEFWTADGLLPQDATPEEKKKAQSVSSISNQGEMRITGVAAEVTIGGQKVRMPWDDPKKNPLTENQFRIEYAKYLGKKEAWLRPNYFGGKDTSEQSLTPEQMHATWE
jgi:hypothetical protein